MNRYELKHLDAEMWLTNRLGVWPRVFEGATTFALRCVRVREAFQARTNLSPKSIQRIRTTFEDCYGEKL